MAGKFFQFLIGNEMQLSSLDLHNLLSDELWMEGG